MALLRSHDISTVLDVGANTGQYASEIRRWGFRGRIESFEPTPAAFEQLTRAAAADPGWVCHQLALGDREGTAELNVTANAASSSLRGVTIDQRRREPGATVVQVLSVPITRLDSFALALPQQGMLLKLDVQGYEDAVLRGAEAILPKISLVECELSLLPLYENQPLLADMLNALGQNGFHLRALNPGYYDVKTGEILQYDGIFARQ